jgi:Peptidase A4 family
VRAWIRIALLAFALLAPAAAARADSASSTNWAGYAVHRSGVSFQSVLASWRQPNVSCSRGRQTYSAYWVGLGGYSPFSLALEQTGTEADCTLSGKAVISAWYELIPAPSIPVKLTVKPGDLIQAAVSVVGHQVTFILNDATRHHAFGTTVQSSAIDVSSAEWIVEAPSTCITDNLCQTLPLANFGAAAFVSAQAQSIGGHTGAIADPAWDRTRIKLSPSGRRFVVYHGSGPSAGAAIPSSLRSGGSSFKVTFAKVAVRAAVANAVRSASLAAAGLLH